VTELQGSYQVAVVGPDNKVDIRPVKAAERIDNLWVIDEGLRPGEQVIVEGLQKIRQGSTVTPRPFVPPQPEDSDAGQAGGQPPQARPPAKSANR
jgi:membrane fusion protein (multidrug efflux system)